jgi:hypothetical protein
LLDDFISNSSNSVLKWLGYFDIYHRMFQKYRGQPITFVEIGVQNGGSTKMWSRYFGPSAKIIGVDVDPNCKALEEDGFEIWIGDQADPEFWQEFTKKHPVIDIVLDDGGHTMLQQISTFNALFPVLSDGGVYLCEDTHTSYFPFHGGGLRKPGTFHEYVKVLIDEMHAWYSAPLDELSEAYIAHNLYSISIFDSIVALEKRLKNPPLALARGYDGHIQNPSVLTHIDMRRAYGVPD